MIVLKYVYVIAWVAVKFGINQSAVLEMGQISQGEAEGNYLFPMQQELYLSLLYPCYSMLIPYSLTFVGVSMYAI